MGKVARLFVGLVVALGALLGCSADVADQQTDVAVQAVCQLQTVQTNPPAPGPVTPGDSVTIQASAACGPSETAQYRTRYRLNGTTTWSVVRGWGGPDFTWNTAGLATGLYELRVEARTVGHAPGVESFQKIDYAVGNYCTDGTLTALDASPQTIGQVADFQASAICLNGATPEYQFSIRYDGQTNLTLVQDWSPNSLFAWNTAGEPAGLHRVQVRVRAAGNASPYEVKKAVDHELTLCGNSALNAGEDCDDGNLMNADGCSSICQFEGNEVEPNEDGTPSTGGGQVGNDFTTVNANGPYDVADGGVNIFGQLNPAGDEDIFALTNTTGETVSVRFDTWDRTAGFGVPCAAAFDTLVNVRDSAGTLVAFGNDRPLGDRCSGGSFFLQDGQTLYIQVMENGDNAITGAYGLQLGFEPSRGCGDGVVEVTEQCDDGNVLSFDGCSNTCEPEIGETEPNEDGSPSTGGGSTTGNDFSIVNANGPFDVASGDIDLYGAMNPVGDEDVFALTNTTGGTVTVRFDTWNRALGPGVSCTTTSIDTVVNVRNAAGGLIAQNDDRISGDFCSGGSFFLSNGETLYLHLMEFGDNGAIPGYGLQLRFQPGGGCGDGFLMNLEQCDDGNLTAGDGCSSTCTVEGIPTTESEPNNSFAEADVNPVQITGDARVAGIILDGSDERDYYRVTVPTDRVVRFETFTRQGDCPYFATALRLYDSGGAPLTADFVSGIRSCSAIVRFLPAGTYYIQVEEPNFDYNIPFYYLEVDFQTNVGSEIEPNDLSSQSNGNLAGGNNVYLFGDHQLSTDGDWYTVTVPAGGSIRAEIIEGDVETCESNEVDSALRLLNLAEVQLTADDNTGRGNCSLIDGTGSLPLQSGAHNLAGGTYYLHVSASPAATPTSGVFNYRLQVTVRSP